MAELFHFDRWPLEINHWDSRWMREGDVIWKWPPKTRRTRSPDWDHLRILKYISEELMRSQSSPTHIITVSHMSYVGVSSVGIKKWTQLESIPWSTSDLWGPSFRLLLLRPLFRLKIQMPIRRRTVLAPASIIVESIWESLSDVGSMIWRYPYHR